MIQKVKSFVEGYRLGHAGKPSALTLGMVEQELNDLEASDPPASTYDWMWHIIGWTCGQAVANFEIGRP